jgi:hypothetical protein
MRTYLFFATMFAIFIFTIVATARPDLIEKQYNEFSEPIKKHFEEERTNAWKIAKEKEWQSWRRQNKLDSDCDNPRTALREVECKNQKELREDTFERIWESKVNNGWKPEGID